VEQGLLFSNYALLHVQVKELSVIVKRRPSEFQWLHDILLKEFPGRFIPPIYKTSEKPYDNTTLLEQKKIFKGFLVDVLNHPEIRRSACLESFLVIRDRREFTLKQKSFDDRYSKKSVRSIITKKTIESYPGELPKIEDFGSLNGRANLKISTNLRSFYHEYQDYIGTAQDIVGR